jgi:hypothetical protein
MNQVVPHSVPQLKTDNDREPSGSVKGNDLIKKSNLRTGVDPKDFGVAGSEIRPLQVYPIPTEWPIF